MAIGNKTKRIAARLVLLTLGVEGIHVSSHGHSLAPQPHTEVELNLPVLTTASEVSANSGRPTRLLHNHDYIGSILMFMLVVGIAVFLLDILSR